MKLSATIAVLVLLGCGSPPPLNAGFAGTWNGTANVHFGAGALYPYFATVVITIDGTVAMISGVCADGTGTATATGSAAQAGLGSFTCAAIPLAGCNVEFTYTQGTMTLATTPSPTLMMSQSGTSTTSCNSTSDSILTELTAIQ